MKALFLGTVLCIASTVAFAESPAPAPQPDVTVVEAQRNEALNTIAQLAAVVKTMQEKEAQREKDWATYSSSLWSK